MALRRILVLLNPHSGSLAASSAGDEPDRIRRGFASRGVDAVVRMTQGADLEQAVETSRGETFDAIVAGGGDGTLNCIANGLAGGPVPFGILPLGTHNHFAKELNLPLDLDDAVAALSAGRVADLDVGEVNGRIFLNFSALGLHPEVVKERDAQQQSLGAGRVVGRLLRKVVKVFVGAIAFFRKLDALPIMAIHLTGGGRTIRRVTPSVIVCNNRHQMQVFGVESVSCSTRAALNVYIAKATGPTGLIRLVLAAFLRRLHTASGRDFEAFCLPALRISLRRRRLRVSVDGEVVDMHTPLEYRVRRGGLKVIVPGGWGSTED